MSRELGTVSQGPYDVAHHPTTKRSFAQPGSLATSADFGDAAPMSEKAEASRYPVQRHRGSRDTHGPFTSHHFHTARPCGPSLRGPHPDDPLPAVRSVRRPRQCRRHQRSRIRLGHRRTQIRSDRKQRHHRHQPQRRREKRSSAGSLLDSVLSQEAWTRCLRRRRHQRMVNRRRR